MAVSVLLTEGILSAMHVLLDPVAMGVVAVDILVKRLLVASGMTMGAPSRTRGTKGCKANVLYSSSEKMKQ